MIPTTSNSRIRGFRRWVKAACGTLATLAAVSTSAQNIEYDFQNGMIGYEGAASALIAAGPRAKDLNYGATPSFIVGAGASIERRGLLRFDLSRLTNRRVAEDASLELTQVNISSFKEGSFKIGVYAIAPANAGWNPGTGSDRPAEVGEVTWQHLAHGDGATARMWAGGPGLSRTGIDHSDTPVAVIEYDAANDRRPVRITLPASLIQQWIDAPHANAGLLFKKIPESGPPSAIGGFFSPQHRSIALRPRLTVIVNQ